ncbi:hypothetical protein SAMN06265379_11446 [Saccharicrinis carchari]|uniref:Uncharacterized protein n=1 Tax=Saccharicrinis carchari TaxID=1168039 RepID=A0A521F5C1_SACCC|nr:hypothetical protein SAMN06265379_11446 [Saccharicrinis carchari]
MIPNNDLVEIFVLIMELVATNNIYFVVVYSVIVDIGCSLLDILTKRNKNSVIQLYPNNSLITSLYFLPTGIETSSISILVGEKEETFP